MPARGSAVKLLLAAVLALVSLVAACGEEGACGGEGAGCGDPGLNRFDSERAFGDLRRQVAFGPRPAGSQANAAQAEFLARRLEQAGAAAVTIQEPWANVVGTIHGDGEGAVLIGAHHDTVAGIPGFVGANDGA
ncbi:MAG: hypothetical protein H0W09_07905, partial [Solirubrobacterales bacterium]|nr:hypothetical protein [Solirubrobacterales bacterium]